MNSGDRPMTEDEKLDEKIAAQVAGDPEAARAAAEPVDGPKSENLYGGSDESSGQASNYPASEVSHVEDEEDAAYHRESCTHQEEVDEEQDQAAANPRSTHPLFEENYGFMVWRMGNGEWVFGQGIIGQTEHDTQEYLYFVRPYGFNMGPNKGGKAAMQVREWPVRYGRIPVSQVSAFGISGKADGPNLFDVYVKTISPVQAANEGDMRAAVRAKKQANQIITDLSTRRR